jgi:hypothetical protein
MPELRVGRIWRFTVPAEDLALVDRLRELDGAGEVVVRAITVTISEVLVASSDPGDAAGFAFAKALRYPAAVLRFRSLDVEGPWQGIPSREVCWTVHFKVTSVAALLDRHPHRPRQGELLAALLGQRSEHQRQLRQAIEDDERLQLLLMRARRDQELQDYLRLSGALTPQAAVQSMRQDAESIIAGEARQPPSAYRRALAAFLLEVAEHPRVVARALERCRGLKRGARQETNLLDSLAFRQNKPVVQRNERMLRYRGSGYQLSGKIDGCFESDGTVIEAKTRQTWCPVAPPDYDVVQLRVYMAMRNVSRGLLSESEQDGDRVRDTEVLHDPAEWESIDAALRVASDEIRAADLTTVTSWIERAAGSCRPAVYSPHGPSAALPSGL